MRVALVNPPWTFDGSIYFGCREPHLPLEYGYARALLEAQGHEVTIVDGQLFALTKDELRREVQHFAPDITVVTTAPSYLFWRCPPPELRIPKQVVSELREVAGSTVVVGPHPSTTPRSTLRKLGADAAVLGECEEVLARLAGTPPSDWARLEHVAVPGSDGIAGRAACDMSKLPALRWPDGFVARHTHHHHRFDRQPSRPGAEVETSRGCPYSCTFCAKDNFRNGFRRRPLDAVLAEIDSLRLQGVEYVYFVDEIFLPWRELLEGLRRRGIEFGVQLRIDNWSEEMLDLLGAAGCVSIEAGIESITPEGRTYLAKNCRKSTEELTRLLLHAKRRVPFVQANLIQAETDDEDEVARWRARLREAGVWSNDPVPMFAYPGSGEYTRRWGAPDDRAWERAHEHYLTQFPTLSEIQEARPLRLGELEAEAAVHAE